jgi:hypothetical protein
MAKFKPFKVPTEPGDTPLVTHAGFAYRCTGCGGEVPDGAWLDEDVKDGKVVGLTVTAGQGGPVVHACGSRA